MNLSKDHSSIPAAIHKAIEAFETADHELQSALTASAEAEKKAGELQSELAVLRGELEKTAAEIAASGSDDMSQIRDIRERIAAAEDSLIVTNAKRKGLLDRVPQMKCSLLAAEEPLNAALSEHWKAIEKAAWRAAVTAAMPHIQRALDAQKQYLGAASPIDWIPDVWAEEGELKAALTALPGPEAGPFAVRLSGVLSDIERKHDIPQWRARLNTAFERPSVAEHPSNPEPMQKPLQTRKRGPAAFALEDAESQFGPTGYSTLVVPTQGGSR